MIGRLQERLIAVAVAAMALLCILALVHVAQVVPLRVPLDPNEGWNAYHAQTAMTGGALYPSAPGMVINNYPPLFFYLDGALGRLCGSDIAAGRALSLIAVAAIASAIAVAIKGVSGTLVDSLFAAFFFIGALLLQSDYVGMSDPQLIGHAVQLPALLILLKPHRSSLSIAAAALLLVIGFFFKHNLIVLPLALAVWLALTDRPATIKLVVFGLAFLTTGLTAFRLAYGVGLIRELRSPRIYSFALLLKGVGAWLAWNGAPLAAAFFALILARRDRFALLCLIYLVFAVVVGAFFYGGAGVDINAMFDAFIALSLAAGFALMRARGAPRLLAASAWLLPLVIGFSLAFEGSWLSGEYWLEPMRDERFVAKADIEFLQKRPGPAICEMLSLCYWAGKPAEVDVFNLGQEYATGARHDDDLAALIVGRYFVAIQIDPDGSLILTPRIKQAFDAGYRLDHANEEDGAFYVPR